MRGGLAWVLVVAGCGFAPASSGVGTDAPAGPRDASSHDDALASDASAPHDAATLPGSGSGSDPTALDCPTGSGWFQVAGSTSWYFVSPDTATWSTAEQNCEILPATGQSATHLAVLSTQLEFAAVANAANEADSTDYWIGMFQQANQSAPNVGWLWVTGGSGIQSMWNQGEPNDDGGFFSLPDHENDDEDYGEMHASSSTLNDESGGTKDRYVCECDGAVPPASVLALVP